MYLLNSLRSGLRLTMNFSRRGIWVTVRSDWPLIPDTAKEVMIMMAHDIKTKIDRLFHKMKSGCLSIRYWDGEEVHYGNGSDGPRVVFNKPLPAGVNLLDPMLAFGEAYMDEVFDIEGRWEDIMRIIAQNPAVFTGGRLRPKLTRPIHRAALGLAFKKQQKANIEHHYDLGNDFFSLWLDETMSYSCGYFKTPEDSLAQAQIQKIDHILKKIQLRNGERLLDIGSGWGWLILRAARQYGVKAVGITLSEPQCLKTQERIQEMGLESDVTVLLRDYLDLDESEFQFDKIVSVGMFEHVGKANLPQYMEKVDRLLAPGGLSLLHSIIAIKEGSVNSWSDRYIFPGGYIPSLREVIQLLPDFDFHLLHAESLRLHYARTLDHWYRNFENHLDEIEANFDRRFVRMWRLYLLTSGAQFRSTGLDIYQLLFSKGLNNQLPLTLDHIYRD